MIIPNLMVRDVAASVGFYRDVLGLSLEMSVAADQSFSQGAELVADPVFAVVSWNGAELMLQSVDSLAAEVPDFAAGQAPQPGGTVYFRGYHPNDLPAAIPEDAKVKPAETAWYGMREQYIRDPDGHILCFGAPDGAPPE